MRVNGVLGPMPLANYAAFTAALKLHFHQLFCGIHSCRVSAQLLCHASQRPINFFTTGVSRVRL